MLEQKFRELCGDDFLHDRLHLGRDELVLGLRRELGLWHFHREDARQAFAHIVAGRLDLGFLGDLFLLDVVVERARHRLPQAGQVRAAVTLRNVVGEALHGFRVRIVPLHRDFDGHALLVAYRMKNLRMQHGLGTVHVLDEALDATGVREVLGLAVALVGKLDLDAIVQKRQLADALGEDLVVKFDARERRRRRHEMDFRAAPVGGTRHRQRRNRNAVAKLDLVRLAGAPDLELEP